MDSLNLRSIDYRTAEFGAADPKVIITVKKNELEAGETASVTVKGGGIGDYIYFIADWGDGTRSFQGPYNGTSTGTLTHVYRKTGSYEIRAAVQSLERDDQATTGWSAPTTVTVSGYNLLPVFIKNVRAMAAKDDPELNNIVDNNSSTSYSTNNWVGLELDKYYTLGTLELEL